MDRQKSCGNDRLQVVMRAFHRYKYDKSYGVLLALIPPINYPDGAPEFKQYGGRKTMGDILYVPNNGSLNFSTISDFKECMRWGREVEFIWKGIHYGVIRYGTNRKITIYQANCPETEKVCDTADEALEYIMGGDRLRDVITQITVMSRTV